MVRGIAAEALYWSGTGSPVMRCCTALVAPGLLSAEFVAVTKSLTLETAHGVRDEDVDVVLDVAGEQGGGQCGRLEGENEEAGVSPLSVFEGGKTPDV